MSRRRIFHLSVSALTLLAAFAVNWLVFGETSPAREYFLWNVGLPNAWRSLNLIPGIISAIAAGNVHGGNELVFFLVFSIQWLLVGLVFSLVLLMFRRK
ncbi:MAG TPA: hypothetical protein VFX97_15475 [Pyrinomonadaceae bacterium]|nr:hypothetical protein [Pyrinomonadaceae bacterium]